MSKPRRRSRGEIDRTFLFADILMKAGGVTFAFILLVAAATPFSLRSALDQGLYQYLSVMTGIGLTGVLLFVWGRRLRRDATHYDAN